MSLKNTDSNQTESRILIEKKKQKSDRPKMPKSHTPFANAEKDRRKEGLAGTPAAKALIDTSIQCFI
jgi:hypothetical protein